MSTKKYDDLSKLNERRTNWKVKVRVIRIWRGATMTGEKFKSFNVLMIDKNETKIHAFVPAKCADDIEVKLDLGRIYSITNFDVETYKTEDKFRCVQLEYHIIFTHNTKVKEVDDDGSTFPQDSFDFYDHSELMQIANKNVYLTDVIGIIKNREAIKLNPLVNKRGQNQLQTKFSITDGSSNVNVTFWDGVAKTFHQELLQQVEDPVIIIITACKVGTWNDEIDLSTVGATTFYLNYNHHSVQEIRKMLSNPIFSQKLIATQKKKKAELLTLSEIKSLEIPYIESEVIAHANIKKVEDSEKWYFNICTQCKQTLESEAGRFFCNRCNRRIPHPEKKYKISIVASDETASIQIILQDQQVRTLIAKRAEQLFQEQNGKDSFPPELKNLQNTNITIKLMIKEVNIVNQAPMYWATNICKGFYIPEEEERQTATIKQTTSQPSTSTSTYHIDGMSQLNFQSTN